MRCSPALSRQALPSLAGQLAACLAFLLLSVASVFAHPHVFVETRSKLIFDDKGEAVSVEHVFRFDDAFSAFAMQGFDKNQDGVYSREELHDLAKINVESMADYGFFTFGDNTKVELDFTLPTSYWMEVVTVPMDKYWVMKPEDFAAMKESQEMNGDTISQTVDLLELHFVLPLKQPTDATHPITLDIYDPTYFVDFRFADTPDAVGTVNAPGPCQVTRKAPPPLDDATAYALAQIGADQRDLPPELQWAADSQVNQMIVNCAPAPSTASSSEAAAGATGSAVRSTTGSASESADVAGSAMTAAAEAGTTDGAAPLPSAEAGSGAAPMAAPAEAADKAGTSASATGSQPAAPATRRASDVAASTAVAVIDPAVSANVHISLLDRIFGTIALKQKEFYHKLVSSLRAFRTNPHAGWLLIGISFLYGIFHAAGPGHGKAVITSYVVANNETLRKGIVLSFASAFAQALTAIVLVGGLAIVFNLTSVAIQDTAWWFEVGSYLLIIWLGGWLLWQKAFRPLLSGLAARMSGNGLALAGAPTGVHVHDHGHEHDHEAGHSHGHGHHAHAHAHAHGQHQHGHSHGHDHHHEIGADGVCSTCGHAHAPTPDMVQGKITLARAGSIILAVGLRPCTGALVVLVFALSQGLIGAGIVATLAMAVGTGITVSSLAGLAVGAKDLAVRLFGEGSPMAGKVHRAIEIVGGAIVFLLGITLLIATVGWG